MNALHAGHLTGMYSTRAEAMKDMKPTDYERFVLCGRQTDVPKTLPVDRRKTYVTGAGQLCEECCMKLYGTADLRETDEPTGK